MRAKQEHLETHGAKTLFEDAAMGHLDHIVMADPEGNEFCLCDLRTSASALVGHAMMNARTHQSVGLSGRRRSPASPR